ncbi:MAG TPA: ATP-dependent DNA helicase RecQ [Bacteroidales bacterium]|nr:ATP-dependent DNA helicase RecQ [Bacteroidales bacterium]HPT52743.1 ATP-dependent DNA helicase RecQ [Bacteroidales bacterium]
MNEITYSEQIHAILKKYWGYDQFRPLQEGIILSVLSGNDTMALLPTGGGKSICFQVPALANPGLCIVISPLIALMKDQVDNLKKKRIKAAAIYSGMKPAEMSTIIDNCLFDKDFKFLYVSPERLKTDAFRINLQRMNINMIAVDEAHCISQWGYDFRPPYLEIAEIRKIFPTIPVLALTATATPEVVKDIQSKLHFKKENVFQKSFKRANLVYYVVKEEDKHGRMLRIMQRYPGTGIVYVRNRRKTQEVATFLQENGISADYYHAGLDGNVRDQKQKAWMDGTIRVIVSTNAFGMGIDKPDVRFVIHIDIPDTLEGYFQEAGRGGRDLKPSVAIMLYDDGDINELHRNFNLSFPPLATIQNVYKQLCNYYRIPIYSGENQMFTFDLNDFAQTYKLNPLETYNSIKLIEKTGILQLSDTDYSPSKLHFLIDDETLAQLNTMPDGQNQQEFIKLLLRSYSGLFTNYVKIHETEIAKRAGITKNQVEKNLDQLHQLQYLDYQKSTNLPTLFFVQNRVDERFLFPDPTDYYRRKEVAKKRLQSVVHYVEHRDMCRSRLLLTYFGERKSSKCEQCDICLKNRKDHLSSAEFRQISAAIQDNIAGCSDIKSLVFKLSSSFDEDKIILVTRWLIDNKQISFSS